MSVYETTRRRVLSVAGGTIVCGLLTTGSVAADEHGQTYRADLSGRPLGIQTAAGGSVTASIDRNTKRGSYELYVDCLRNARRATLSIAGEQIVGVIELDDGTEGLVRKTTIAEGPLSEIERGDVPEAAVRSALEDDDLMVTVHTDQHPRGEIAGVIEPVGEDGSGEDSDSGGDETDDSSSTGDDNTDVGGPDSGSSSNGDYDCADFDTQADAQEVYEQDTSDPYGLDGDDDEEACERLPSGRSVSLTTSTINSVRSLLS